MKHSSPTAAVALNDAITALVCRTYRVTPAELASKCRAQHIAWSRFTVWYLLRRLTPLSFPRIGMLVGDVDHSTVIHGINEVKARMRELAFSREIEKMIDELKPQDDYEAELRWAGAIS